MLGVWRSSFRCVGRLMRTTLCATVAGSRIPCDFLPVAYASNWHRGTQNLYTVTLFFYHRAVFYLHHPTGSALVPQYMKVTTMGVEDKNWPLTRIQLRAGRLMAGFGVRELSAKSHVSTTTINLIETGRVENPRVQTLLALRRALEGAGVEFHSGGWMRHVDDSHHCNPSQRNDVEIALLQALRYLRTSGESDNPDTENPPADRSTPMGSKAHLKD